MDASIVLLNGCPYSFLQYKASSLLILRDHVTHEQKCLLASVKKFLRADLKASKVVVFIIMLSSLKKQRVDNA